MSDASSVDAFLSQATEQERAYDWLGATEFYGKALSLVHETNCLKLGQVQEKMGYAFYRAAMHAGSVNEFRDRMRQAVANYSKAKESYDRMKEPKKTPWVPHCDAMIAYLGYWLATEVPERKRLLDECWRIEKDVLKVYENTGDQHGFAKSCIELIECLDDRLDLELDIGIREQILDEALNFGEKAIRIFSDAGEEHELARAYCITGVHCYNAALSLEPETKRKECEEKAFDYLRKAIRISENIGDKLLRCRSIVWLGYAEVDLGTGSEAASELIKEALDCSTDVKDNRILSELFDGLLYSNTWSMSFEEDLEKRIEKSRKSEEYASKAISHSILANYDHGIPHSFTLGYVDTCIGLAIRQTELRTRHELLKKAVTLGKQDMERAQSTGSTHAILHASDELADALYYYSTTKTGVEKRKILEETMTLGEKCICYTEQLRPHFMFVRSAPYATQALVLFELGKLEENKEKRKELLEKSVSHMETRIELIQRHLASFALRRELLAVLGYQWTVLGNILKGLYQTTGKEEILRKLIVACQSAAEMFGKVDLCSRVAEVYWQAAMAYDHLGQYSESAGSFESASKQYELSAHNIPQLRLFYMNHAMYMQAWNEIEKGRHHHARQEFGLAREHFEKAAEVHRSLKQWCYLAPNYAASAQVENAEDLSRKELSEEALQAFKEAVRLFSETKKSLEAELPRIENVDEKQTVCDILETTETRREYCTARIALEEAEILDRKGDHYLASKEYGSAAEAFKRIEQASESDQERKEIGFIRCLSQAWQKMMLADARASPELYLEASELFEQASRDSYNEPSGLQALGHSRFCKALEAGTRFADTRDRTMHAKAVQFLESAANYYAKAGFPKASEYVKATELLFDAYVRMDNAKKEEDPEKKAKLYVIAEKVLQTAAGSFMKAEHPEKREQVLRLLEQVKEERELAVSITEVLHAPSTVSITTSFSAPTPTSEEAVGSERFEHADVQANLVVRRKELKVGESLHLEIELVNAGKGPALLTKITELIPEGFELAEKPEIYRVEDSYIDMKGKRLDPLKMVEVKIVLRPRVQGAFPIKPRILYIDENGKYKSHEPESITITVKELGIKGWIKGER